jgi:glycerophosphoryl diester phosphodiesterase
LEAAFEQAPSGEMLPIQIAHAGGAFEGHNYSNSVEALDFWYGRGCRWFEIDLDWTSDGRLAAIHDWNAAAERLFGDGFSGCWMTRKAFLEQRRLDGLTSIDDEGLGRWLGGHPDAVVVTDNKWANVDALALLSVVIPGSLPQLVPQIYAFEEYDQVRALGFERLILTLYRMEAEEPEILEFVVDHQLLAVTLPEDRAFGSLPRRLSQLGVPTFAHTVNDADTFRRLRDRGVHGIYTDSLCGCEEDHHDG